MVNITKDNDFGLGIWTKNSDAEDPNHKYDMVIEKKDSMGQGKNAKIEKNQTYAYDHYDGFIDINPFGGNNGMGNACIKAYYKK